MDAGDVDRHHALDALGRHLVDAHAALADNATVVDERPERTELIGRLEQREDIAFLGDVAFHRDGLAVLALDFANDFVRRRLVTGVTDDDPKAAGRRGNRGGAADAAATAGDNNAVIADHDSITTRTPPQAR